MNKTIFFFSFILILVNSTNAQNSWSKLIQKDKNKQQLLFNDIKTKSYDRIIFAKVNQDSTRVAFVAKQNGRLLLVIDTLETEYESIDENSITFSPKGKRIFYIAKKDKSWVVYFDGNPQVQIENYFLFNFAQLNLQFSPNEERISYIISKDTHSWPDKKTKKQIIIDGKEDGKLYENILYNRFSPDGQHSLYVGKKENGKWIVVVDGIEDDNEIDDFMNFTPIFSPDSKHIAYGAKMDSQWFMFTDNKFSPYLACTDMSLPVFSRNCDSLAYLAQIDNNWSLIINNKNCGNYKVESVNLNKFWMIAKLEDYFSLSPDRLFPILINSLKGSTNLVRKVNTYTMAYPVGFFDREKYGKSLLEIGVNHITVSYEINTVHWENIFNDFSDKDIDLYFSSSPGHIYSLETSKSASDFISCKYLGEKFLGIVDITNKYKSD